MIATLVLAAAIAIPPRPNDYVTDNAGALSEPVAYELRNELRSYEQVTKHHVIVWIGETTGDTPLEDWTIRAAEQWKVGRKGADDGAILFVFMRDHKVRIEVGYGLESSLTDATASQIIRNIIVPRMRAGNPDGAVQGGVDRMLLTITPSFASQIHRDVPRAEAPAGNIPAAAGNLLVSIALLIVLSIMSAARRGRRGAWYWGGVGSGLSFGGGGSGGGFGGGSFGGGFGGGGASGGW